MGGDVIHFQFPFQCMQCHCRMRRGLLVGAASCSRPQMEGRAGCVTRLPTTLPPTSTPSSKQQSENIHSMDHGWSIGLQVLHSILFLWNIAILMLFCVVACWHRFLDDSKGFVLGNDGVLLRYLGWNQLPKCWPFCIRWRYSTWSVYTTCNGICYYCKRRLLLIVFAFSLAQKSVKMYPWLLYYKLWMKQYHSHQKHSFVSISDCQSPLVTTLPVILLLCGLTAHSTHVHHWSRRVILAISILSFQKELHLFKRWFWHVFWWEREKIA